MRRLPEGFSGAVLSQTAPSAAARADEHAWVSTATFRSLTYWNHDAVPAASDWQARAIDWLVLADKVGAGNLGSPRTRTAAPCGSGFTRPLHCAQTITHSPSLAPLLSCTRLQSTASSTSVYAGLALHPDPTPQVHAPVSLAAVEAQLAPGGGGGAPK